MPTPSAHDSARPGRRSRPEDLLFHLDERFRLEASSPIPLYHQMESVILERIRSSGERAKAMPTEADLAKIFGVSRATIRKVNESLTAKGIIQARRSIGTQIVSKGVSEDLGRLTSFTEQMRARGLTISTKVLRATVEPAPSAVASRLNLRAGERVLSIRRLRGTAETFPIVLLHSSLPESLRISAAEDFNGSLYDTIETKYGIAITWAEEEISAATATDEEATALGITSGSPVLVMERLTFGPGNRPVEFVRATYIPEHYKFRAKMKR